MDLDLLQIFLQQAEEITYIISLISFFCMLIYLFIFLFPYSQYFYRIFFPGFEKKYNLNKLPQPVGIAQENKMKSKYAKILIVTKLTKYYNSYYWPEWKRKNIEKFLMKCEKKHDIYYYAYRNLIDKEYVIKDEASNFFISNFDILNKRIVLSDVRKIMFFYKSQDFFIYIVIIGAVSIAINKYIIPKILKIF